MTTKLTTVTAALMLAITAPVFADTISDSLTVFSPTGAIFSQVTATEGQEATNGPGIIYIIPNVPVNPGQFGSPTTLFENNNPSFSSDIFGSAIGLPGCQNTNGLCLAFASDTETLPQPFGTGPNNFPEGNGSFDATLYLDLALQAQGYTARFGSDVPEPTSLWLLGVGAVAMAFMTRRKG